MKELSLFLSLYLAVSSCQSDRTWKTRIENFNGLDTIRNLSVGFKDELEGNLREIILLDQDSTIAPFYFNIRLYPAINLEKLHKIEQAHNFFVPKVYQDFLTQINGAFVYGIALYGIPKTLIERGTVNRKELEPLNLYSANKDWKREMKVDQSLFLIGGSPYSDTTNIYYFLKDGKVVGLLEEGKQVDGWNSINDMLENEINRLKK